MKKLCSLLAGLALALWALPAQAQTFVTNNCSLPVTYSIGSTGRPIAIDTHGATCINGSITASLSGFPTSQSTGTPIAVTTGGVTGTLPTGAVVVATNVGTTNGAYCKLGASATTSDQFISPNGGWFAFTVGANTQLTCITSTSTTTVNMVGGSGLPTGTGGGGGGGSGGSVTQGTSPWVDNVTQLGGNAINLGAGATGTGTQRITQASDSPEIAVLGATGASAGCGTTNTVWQCLFQIDNDVKSGTGATGSSVPSTALYPGLRGQNAEQTAVTNGQLVGQASDLTGKAIFLPYANPENGLNGQITAAMTGTSSTAVTGMGAQGAGVRNYVTQCTFSNSHATVGTMILLQDGSGGTTLWQAPAAPAFGGAVVQFPTPIKTTANTALFAQNVTTGSNTFVSCTGYKGI